MAQIVPPPPGLYTPALTFFTEDDKLDIPNTLAHYERQLAAGVRGLVILGSNAEAVHLLPEERLELIRLAKDLIKKKGGDIPIIVGCSGSGAKTTLRLIEEAVGAGADYALVLAPSYWVPAMTKPVLKSFFLEVARNSPVPVIVYNFPGAMGGINIGSDTITELNAAEPNIVGVKLNCGDMGKLVRLASGIDPSTFTPFIGKAEHILPGMIAGSNTLISAMANIVPKTLVEVMRLYQAGEIARAQKIQADLAHAELAMGKVGISGFKGVCVKYFGYGNYRTRNPLPTLGEEAFTADIVDSLQKVIALEKSL